MAFRLAVLASISPFVLAPIAVIADSVDNAVPARRRDARFVRAHCKPAVAIKPSTITYQLPPLADGRSRPA